MLAKTVCHIVIVNLFICVLVLVSAGISDAIIQQQQLQQQILQQQMLKLQQQQQAQQLQQQLSNMNNPG